MKVSEVMTAQVAAAQPSSSIKSVGKMMSDVDTGAIPVVEDGRIVGLVTDRDIVLRAVAEDANLDAAVSTIMTDAVQTIGEDESVADAVGKMSSLKIRRLLVVNDAGRMVGIVSLGDISKDYGAKQVGKTLEDISFAPPQQ
jgi:predicted transcriptional regulator